MIFDGEVTKVEDAGEDVRVTVTNIRRRDAASWREYSNEIVLRVPHPGRSFYIGRGMKIEVTPK